MNRLQLAHRRHRSSWLKRPDRKLIESDTGMDSLSHPFPTRLSSAGNLGNVIGWHSGSFTSIRFEPLLQDRAKALRAKVLADRTSGDRPDR
jgi:hypothetical protein